MVISQNQTDFQLFEKKLKLVSQNQIHIPKNGCDYVLTEKCQSIVGQNQGDVFESS